MQDVYCPRCAEPVEIDYFHDVAAEEGSTYRQVLRAFQTSGCEAIGYGRCERSNPERAAMAEAMYDLLGDDMDGAAAMFEDSGYF